MLSRTFLFAACLALATAKDVKYTSDSAQLSSCGGKEVSCVGGTLNEKLATCTYTDGTSCYLCSAVAGMDKCADPVADELGCAVIPDGTVTLTVGQVAVSGSGAGNGLPVTYPNSGTTLTLGTYHGMSGWGDIGASKFYDFTEFYKGIVATIPSFYTKANFRVTYSCNSAGLPGVVPADFKGCNIFLFAYRCPPCDARDGNIGVQLLAMPEPKWYAAHCGPTFKLNNEYGVNHQFAAYSAEVEDNTDTVVKLEHDVQFMFWAIVGKSVVCQAKSETECGNYPINCQWDSDSSVCKPRECELHPWAGPSKPRCSTCVADEEEFIPEVKL